MNQLTKCETDLAPKHGTGSSRRDFIRSAVGLTISGALISLPMHSFATSLLSGSHPVDDFITLSQTITEHQQIDAQLAARFFAVFSQNDPQFAARVTHLGQLLKTGDNAQQLLDKARGAGLKEFLYQIVIAWYTGTVGNDYRGTLVTYQQALMYLPVSDGLIVPTYCGNGPIWWDTPVPNENDGLIATL